MIVTRTTGGVVWVGACGCGLRLNTSANNKQTQFKFQSINVSCQEISNFAIKADKVNKTHKTRKDKREFLIIEQMFEILQYTLLLTLILAQQISLS